jgi:hypothetical protein
MRKPDLVGRLQSGALAHLELQGDNDDDMEWRELEYYYLLHRLYGQPPMQYVLYFGSEKLRMRNSITHPMLQYRYTLLDVRNINPHALLGSAAMGDQTLALLCETVPQAETVQHVLANLQTMPENLRRDWIERILVLSGIRSAEDIIKEEATKMAMTLDIRNNKFWQEAQLNANQSLLLSMLKARFGTLPSWVEEKLATLDTAALEQLGIRLLTAPTLEDIFAVSKKN